EHVLALRSDGTVWSWGSNARGQLGYGYESKAGYATPAQVSGLTDVVGTDYAGTTKCGGISDTVSGGVLERNEV
ncbi:MAG: hypothetical protein IJD26_00895, partial [Lachnospiraceae bacterium]|nr:hypothetical protein [Lachnospiraceae bacterium]